MWVVLGLFGGVGLVVACSLLLVVVRGLLCVDCFVLGCLWGLFAWLILVWWLGCWCAIDLVSSAWMGCMCVDCLDLVLLL